MLAIVIPFYKIDFFEETLNSLGSQICKDFKVYIGNDGSTREVESLLVNYKGVFDYRYHYFKDNMGQHDLVAHWERCIAMIEEEQWMMILGDDDTLGPNVINSWYEHHGEFDNKSSVVRFASQEIDENSVNIGKPYFQPSHEKAIDSYLRKLTHENRSSLSEYIFSRATYKKFGFVHYPLAWNTDDRAWLDFSDGRPLYSINDAIVNFRISSKNISGSKVIDKRKLESQLLFVNHVIVKYLITLRFSYQILLIENYERAIRKLNKLSLKEFFIITRLHLKIGSRKHYFRFIRRTFVDLFN